MTRIWLSVVIPAYNSWETVEALLLSLRKSSFKQFEVIIGDDASHTEKPKTLLGLLRQPIGRRSVQMVRLPVNRGPAAARNAAAKRAKAPVILFLDADVTVYPDTLARVAQKFQDDPDLTALTGVWDKKQHTHAFFPQFKALRDWSYWTNERGSDGYYYLFSTRIAAIKRDVFTRLGRFNEAFRQMEDVELTYRIAKRYAIIFAPDVRVHHEFESFMPIARKYFWRSFYWMRLYKERRKFDPVATTVWESLAAVTAVGAVGLFAMGVLLFFLAPVPFIKSVSIAGAGILLVVHLILLWKFLRFVAGEKGLMFMMKSLLTGIVLYCVIAAGSLYSIMAAYISTQTRRRRA